MSAFDRRLKKQAKKWTRRLLEWLIELLSEPSAPCPTGRLLQPEDVRSVWEHPLSTTGFGLDLRPYQAFGAKYILEQRRILLGDEMGLGKTIQALAAIYDLWQRGARRFLVVAPAAVIPNWLNEIGTCTPLPRRMLYGPQRAQAIEAWRQTGGIGVTSYETMRREELHELLDAQNSAIDLLVLDEAHYIKNPEAGRTRAACELLSRSDYVVMLTGTPLENRPEEFARLLELVAPQLASAVHDGSDEHIIGPRAFRRRVAGVYLRRNQEDVLDDLPPAIEREEWISLRDADRAAYREAVRSGNYMAMRRVVTLGNGIDRSAKLSRLVELCRTYRAQNRKVAVFSFFLDVLDAVAELTNAMGRITGSVPASRRETLLEEFRRAKGHQVLACQVQAGGIGINMQAASAVILMEPQYKPSTEEQAIARVVRMGQSRRVVIHRLLARDTVDEPIHFRGLRKLEHFEDYARDSLIRRLAECESEDAMAEVLVEYEQSRL